MAPGDHADCILAIVGSRDVARYQAESLIQEALVTHKPKMVVSGGASGVDTFGVQLAHEAGIATVEYIPEHNRWDAAPTMTEPIEQMTDTGMRIIIPGGFKTRNEKVAQSCDCLVRIASRTTKTFGSGWTADQAERLGKNVTRHTV